MESDDLLDCLLAIARTAGVEVRETKGGAESDAGPHSASCRLRGQLCVILVAGDPIQERISAVADALDQADPSWLETHYLPPALRTRLEDRPGRLRG